MKHVNDPSQTPSTFKVLSRRLRRRWILSRATAARARSKATFIAVTGSSTKSTTVGLISHILSAEAEVQTRVFDHRMAHITGTLRSLSKAARYAVFEVGAVNKGDVKAAGRLLKPDVGVVTFVDREHYKVFRGFEGVAKEKGDLAEAVGAAGLVLLNADEPLVAAMAARTKARVLTFGRSEEADYRAVDIRAGYPATLSLAVERQGRRVELTTRFAGQHYWLPVVVAFAVAAELGIDERAIAERIASFEPFFTRGRVVATADGPTFIVDTTKAPLDTLGLAFDMIERASAPRKRIVLGQISDIPGSERPKYRDAYRACRAIADEVIFVGAKAHSSMAPEEDRLSGRFHEFATTQEVLAHLRRTALPGELILLKGSTNLHMERIALDWISDVRCWADECGKVMTCLFCARFHLPYTEHEALHRDARRASRWPKSLRRWHTDRTGEPAWTAHVPRERSSVIVGPHLPSPFAGDPKP